MATRATHRSERRHSVLLVAAVWFFVVALAGLAFAADGDLDDTFGGDGKVTTTFRGGAFASAVAVQPDGMIVAAGAAAGGSGTGEFALARYETDGDLDPSFGNGGKVTTLIGAGGDEARSVAVQKDGKIVVAGTAGRDVFALARYQTDGDLDPTFGTGGVVTTNFTEGDDIAYDVVIQPDGRIVAAGSAGDDPPSFALARYKTGGNLDPTFGGDGKVKTRFGIWGIARALALQANGKIVVVGFNGKGFALARYLPDGRLDDTFGGDGKVGNSFRLGWANAVAIQPDGKIVAAGDRDIFRFALARYTVHGRLDTTFGGDGRVVTRAAPGAEQGIAGLVIQPNGKIVGAGAAGPHEYGDPVVWRFVLARYRGNGTLDPTFGGDGKVVTRFEGGAYLSGAAAQADGRIVVAGGAGEANAEAFALARYLT